MHACPWSEVVSEHFVQLKKHQEGGPTWARKGGGLLTQIPSLTKEAAQVSQRWTQGHTGTARSHGIPVLVALHRLCCPLLQTLASLKCPECLPGGHRPVFSSLLVASQEEQTCGDSPGEPVPSDSSCYRKHSSLTVPTSLYSLLFLFLPTVWRIHKVGRGWERGLLPQHMAKA